MLKDRRVLLETDLKIARDQAAKRYLNMVVSGDTKDLVSYQALRDRATNLQFDLDIVNKLIEQGAD
jgi:hypothetical protein